MTTIDKIKKCICSVPTVMQVIPDGFTGTVLCSKCGGVIEYPLQKNKKFNGDPVKQYLSSVNERESFTDATITNILLSRILDALSRGKK